MKILIEIPDSDATFTMKVLKSLSFVKKVKPMRFGAVSLWNDLKGAAQEVRLHKDGKIKLQTLEGFLNEV